MAISNWQSAIGNRGRRWKALARLVVLAAVLALVARHFNPGDFARDLARVKIGYVACIVLVASPLAVVLRALRWRFLLAAGNRVPLRAYVGAYLVGALANAVLLGRFGDFVKARFISKPVGSGVGPGVGPGVGDVTYGRSLSVVVIDRLLEGLALLVVFAAVLATASLPAWASRLAWLGGGLSLAALIALRLLFGHRAGFLRLAERALARVPASIRDRLLTAVEGLLAGCEALASYRRVMVGLVYAFAVWGVEIATVAILLRAFSVPAPRFLAAIVLVVVLTFGMLVPTSPGSVGVYQLLCVFTLSLWGVDRQLALAFGIVMQAVLFVPLYLAGLVWLAVGMRGDSTWRGKLAATPAAGMSGE